MSWAKAKFKVLQRGSVVVALRRFCYSAFMSMGKLLLIFGMGLLPFQTKAQGATNQLSYVMCKAKKIVRTIRVTTKGDECTTVYTKSGVDRVVSNGKSRQSCIGVMENIKGNLEGAQWKCKDISTASVTDGN